MIIHKPFLGSRDVPQKIWARSVQPFWRLLDTNKQTDKQTPRQAKFMYRRWDILTVQIYINVIYIIHLVDLCIKVEFNASKILYAYWDFLYISDSLQEDNELDWYILTFIQTNKHKSKFTGWSREKEKPWLKTNPNPL